jgi:DNA-binding CsgD family transcriptional regulator
MARPAPTSVLTALGFSPQVDRIYQRLRSQSGREIARVAASMLRTPDELLADLEPLRRTGIVRVEGGEVVVEPPAEALRIMMAAQALRSERARRRLEGMSEAVKLLASEEGRPAPSEHERSLPIEGEVITAADEGEIYAMVRSLILRSRGDLLWFRPDQWRGPQEDLMTDLVREALGGPGGRTSRAIYPVRAVSDGAAVLAGRAAAGEQIRVLPELPTRLLVIGDSHAVLPEPLGYADMPLTIVRQRGVVEATAHWFELLWERAAVHAVGTAGRRDLRRFLLQQLAAGEHDEQIARRLGISLRTVRRRVADLMSELGADSRFQAGVEAARRGWI